MKFHIAQLLDLFSFDQLCRLSGNLEMRERLMDLSNSEWLLTMQSRDLLVARSTVVIFQFALVAMNTHCLE